jgi:pimeloyl-ACP methyl ester carboxylesterase
MRRDWHVIAPDLRGHGDSQWSPDGNYAMAAYVYDLAQLVHQQELAPVTIVAHSLGGNIALRYAGTYPDAMRRLVSIEGLGPAPAVMTERARQPIDDRMRAWIAEQRSLSGRTPRRYVSVEEALRRMQEENKHLSTEQARHLTRHGIHQNEDGTYSWKFDNYVRSRPPYDMAQADLEYLWGRITCPTLLVYGNESWASNPSGDGRAHHFQNARVVSFERAGHWVQHDRLDAFLAEIRAFLGP